MIRPATAADLAAAAALWEVAGGPTRTPGSLAVAERLFARDPEALLVAVDGDEVVGTIVVGWDGWRCHLYRLAVLPAHRRRGIAAELVAAAVERASALGATRLDAMVADANHGAVAFWAAAGFGRDDDDHRWSCSA
ncbi:MAG: Acetyltransferase [Actinomycetia bacterium]|nr:Acetyltransferase [Actinomycetes bacterium]